MAKKRRSFRMRARGLFKRRGHSKKSVPLGAVVLGGAVYGVGRQYVSNLISPLTSKIPLGNLADNLAMGLVSYYAAKKGTGMVKEIGRAGLYIEAALAGQDLMSGGLSNISGSSSSW